MEKSKKNTYAVACKLRRALIRVTNHRLEVLREKKRKSKEIVKRQKTKAIAIKHQRPRQEISIFSDKKGNDKNDIRDEIDLDQTNDKYLLSL